MALWASVDDHAVLRLEGNGGDLQVQLGALRSGMSRATPACAIFALAGVSTSSIVCCIASATV